MRDLRVRTPESFHGMNGGDMQLDLTREAGEGRRPRGSALEVLLVFLRLGCSSFGGPIAHLGYFQKEIVERRKWCSESTLAEVIALAQSLPGPASSQVGFALGILRAGWKGGIAAWIGFTLPSALLMLAFAYGHSFLSGVIGSRTVHGLQIVAVAVVAQAVMSMQRRLAPDRVRMLFALLAAGVAMFGPRSFSTMIAIAFGAIGGLVFLRSDQEPESRPALLPLPRRAGAGAGGVFLALLMIAGFASPVLSNPAVQVFSAFYRTGAFVFGGGHVVLPLLENSVVARGWVTQPAFLAGYGVAQALPGPLFTFGAYLGAMVRPSPSPFVYGLLGLLGIFLPGLLAMAALLPFWDSLRRNVIVQAMLKGVNASVVGVLIAALYQPLWTTAIHTATDFWFALLAFMLLTLWKVAPWIVVAVTAVVYTMASLA